MKSGLKVYIAACAVVVIAAVVFAVGLYFGTQRVPASADANNTPIATEVSTTTSPEVWDIGSGQSTTTVDDTRVTLNTSISTVAWPLSETPDITDPPRVNEDMDIVFVQSSSLPDQPDRLDQICFASFPGGTKLCIEPYVLTSSEDDYDYVGEFPASVMLNLVVLGAGCDSFEACFEMLADSGSCQQALDYLDNIGRQLAADSGYNGGWPGIDPSKVKLTYWDVDTENLQLEFTNSCTVSATQH